MVPWQVHVVRDAYLLYIVYVSQKITVKGKVIDAANNLEVIGAACSS